MKVKVYRGFRKDGKAYVTVQKDTNAEPEYLRNFVKFNPVGFDWGHGGSGATGLSWSLLMDVLGPEQVDFIEFIHQRFKKDVIINLDEQEWTLTSEMIEEAIKDYKNYFDEEYNKKVTITSNIDDKLILTATGNVENLIKLSDEIKALTSQIGMDLSETALGSLYIQILAHCEKMKQNMLNKMQKDR